MDEDPKRSEWKEKEKAKFDEIWTSILEKDTSLLTEYDKQFLTARRHLLNKDQQETYGDIIKETMNANLRKFAKTTSKAPKQPDDSADEDEEE